MREELCFLPAVELRALIAEKKVSPVELMEDVVARAQRLQPLLNCFITLCADEAMDQARAAEKAVMAGRPLGRLHGIPYTVKDLVNTQGVRTTFGAVPLADNVPTQDALAIARLRSEGAILLGKTTTPEFGSKCLTDSPLFGRTRNAWSAQHTSGGSSGGAAVAVASGLAPLAVATDGGGSTRIPAACNGVVGFKQSIGVVPHSQAQDAIGNQTFVTPTTRTVADTALMLQAMAGADPCDPWSAALPPQDFEASARPAPSLKGRRILFRAVPSGRMLSRDVASAFDKGLAVLASLGAELEEMPAEGFDVEPMWRAINHTVWRARFLDLVAQHRERLSATFVRQIESAAEFSAVQYQQAMFDRTALLRHVESLLSGADAIVMPTLTRTALPIAQDLFEPLQIDETALEGVRANWFPWTMPFNMTGHPAVSLPCGFGADGLPIGIQMVGHLKRDADLLGLAATFEQAYCFTNHWPSEASRQTA